MAGGTFGVPQQSQLCRCCCQGSRKGRNAEFPPSYMAMAADFSNGRGVEGTNGSVTQSNLQSSNRDRLSPPASNYAAVSGLVWGRSLADNGLLMCPVGQACAQRAPACAPLLPWKCQIWPRSATVSHTARLLTESQIYSMILIAPAG